MDEGWILDLEEKDSFCKISNLIANTSIEVCFLCRLPYLDYENKNNSEVLEKEEDEDDKEKEEPDSEKLDRSEFETEFGIYISKLDKKTMFIEGVLTKGRLTLIRTYFLTDDLNLDKHQELFKKDLLKNLHNGLNFEIVSDDIQYAMAEYLMVFGMEEEFFLNMQKLSFLRENELYHLWLKDFKNFLNIN